MVPGTRLVMLGKQGAGKGTQCIRLSRHYVVPHISTGDMFRNAVRSRSAAGVEAKTYMDAGELIPDSVVIGLVAERLSHTDTANRGFVLDGFPRTVAQAEALAELLSPRGLDVVIDLEVDTEVVLKRLASRRVCTDCGANYSAERPPKTDWVCDVCGGEVVQREDDTEAAIRRRLELYERETAPLIAWYSARGILAPVNGMGPPDEVAARLVEVVDDSRQRGLVEAAQHAQSATQPSAGSRSGSTGFSAGARSGSTGSGPGSAASSDLEFGAGAGSVGSGSVGSGSGSVGSGSGSVGSGSVGSGSVGSGSVGPGSGSVGSGSGSGSVGSGSGSVGSGSGSGSVRSVGAASAGAVAAGSADGPQHG